MSVSAPLVHSYALYTERGQEKRAVNYLKKLRKAYNNIVDAVVYPFKCYVRLDVAFNDNGTLKDLKLDLPKDMKAKIEGCAGIIKICGNGSEAVPLN
ncbi:MAG: hypothetical protein K6U74_00545 [Firmicutes bacterium]|nr:hypothetical protein [Bacillota bacterium]